MNDENKNWVDLLHDSITSSHNPLPQTPYPQAQSGINPGEYGDFSIFGERREAWLYRERAGYHKMTH